MSGASGTPGLSLMMRKRSTPSVMRSVRSSAAQQLGVAGVELQQVVLGVGVALDRVGQRALAPLVVAQQLAPASIAARVSATILARAASSACGSSSSTRSYVGAGRVMRIAARKD